MVGFELWGWRLKPLLTYSIFGLMLDWIIELDKKLLLLINSWNTPWLDSVMFTLTNAGYWTPLFILVIGMMVYHFKWRALIPLFYLILVIILTDQISASILKPLIGRLRPSHDPELGQLVHLVNGYRGGRFSFVSSHAANAFGVATFLWLVIRKQINWIWIMFVWAAIFTYTRMYLGVHYPLDVICGGLIGAALAHLVVLVGKKAPGRFSLGFTSYEHPTY